MAAPIEITRSIQTETDSEDTFHMGRMASAFVAGLQQHVIACAKHFAANNIENGRNNQNAQMDEQTLRENYTKPFQILVEEADPACIMAAYNGVQGGRRARGAPRTAIF